MSSSRFTPIGRFFRALWWGVDASRRLVLNLFFLGLVVLLVVAYALSGPAVLTDKTALVLDLQGALVEQRSANARDTALAQVGARQVAQDTQLREVLAVLESAAKDSRIGSVVLLLDEFEGAGLPALREVAAALERFKASGKPVLAWGMGFDQRQYYLAAQANEVYLHPMGLVLLQGFGGYRNYYREALDRLGISVNLVRVGSFKSAGESYVADGPSPESVEADSFLYNAMWSTYTQGVEKARKLEGGSVMTLINDLPQRLAAAGGDAAKVALNGKLVDGLKTRDEFRQAMIDKGAATADGKTFRQVSFSAYLARQKALPVGDAVGVVVAEGAIVDGPAPAGTVGGVSTAELVRKARLNPRIKALVLRVNSPGGSPLGSELVRRELELTRSAGKPVVVSMGDVAASGGYWVTMAADEVVADEASVTGSIGVFALLPNADKAMEKVGLHTGGVTTTWLGAAGDPRRPPDERLIALLQTSIDHVYADFTAKAAAARKTTPQAIDAVAQGRVWTGAQAKERGLVDTVGGFHDALRSAAARAKLAGEGDALPRLIYIEPERSVFDRILGMVGGATARVIVDHLDGAGATPALSPLGLVPPRAAREVQQDLAWLARLADTRNPFASVAHCLCGKY
jgi:protease-4